MKPQAKPQRHRMLLVGLVWGSGALLLAALLVFLVFTLQFSGYRDRTYGFTMKYPSAWRKIVAPQPGAAVAFVSPKENALDIFQENVNVTLNDLSGDVATLTAYRDRVLLQMTKVFPNLKLIEARPQEFAGRPGYRIIFEAVKPDPMRMLVVFTTRGGQQAYVLTYMATIRKYQQYLPLVQEMVRSFRLQ